jgi:hypothetical protein
VFGVMTDVTEHKKVEQSLENQRQVLEMVASGASLSATLDKLARGLEALLPACAPPSCCSTPTASTCAMVPPPPAGGLCPGHRRDRHRGGVGSCGTAAATGKAVIVEDIARHPCGRPMRRWPPPMACAPAGRSRS